MGEGEGMERHSGHRKNSYMFLEKGGGGGCFFVNLYTTRVPLSNTHGVLLLYVCVHVCVG